MQTDLNFTRPRPADLFSEGSQNDRLYRRLLEGPVTNAEIVRGMGIFNSTGRVSDIRKKLRDYLMDIEASHDGNKSLWIYKLRG